MRDSFEQIYIPCTICVCAILGPYIWHCVIYSLDLYDVNHLNSYLSAKNHDSLIIFSELALLSSENKAYGLICSHLSNINIIEK